MEQNQMSKFCIDLEGVMLPDAIAAVVEAWYDAQSSTFSNLAESWDKKITSKQPAGVCKKNNAKRQEIINQTISNIKNGILLPGSKMPTLRNLAEILECNKNTIFKAYKEMEEKGIIKSDGRSGYCVAQIAISHGI
jgi:predicted transcriptional regulator